MSSSLDTITMRWDGRSLWLLDQRKLPGEISYVQCSDFLAVSKAISDMIVRGAPAIGAAAAFGYLLGAIEVSKTARDNVSEAMGHIEETLSSSRPTAVNLFWALNRMHKCFDEAHDFSDLIRSLETEALSIAEEDIMTNRRIGKLGASLLRDNTRIITHCNAGALATVDYGTALGVIRAAHEQGKKVHVFVDETRPYLQGARLTSWELMNEGISCTLITDNMAGWVMKSKGIDVVIVGADRIAANGDTANKIGSYSLAILASHHGIPFYVVAPSSTLDSKLDSGEEIPIEERPYEEITHISGVRIAPENVNCFNPAFDVVPAELITAIITEHGVNQRPYDFRTHPGY